MATEREIDQALDEIRKQLHAIEEVFETELVDLDSGEGWVLYSVWVRLPE